jgi:hypothetical protein
MDLTETTAPKSDQQNFDDYAAGITRTVTVTEVKRGNAEQPAEVHLAEFPGRPYKPSKSMRRVLVAAWGPDTTTYAGRRITLYGDPTVKFGGNVVGGIKISNLSHIDKRIDVSLTETRGKRAKHTVEPLIESAPVKPTPEPIEVRAPKAIEWFAAKSVPQSALEAHVSKPVAEWSHADLDTLMAARDELTGGQS